MLNSEEKKIVRIFYRLVDGHHHLRDGEMLKNIVMYLARYFSAAMIMPNLQPPVVTTKEVAAYLKRILACLEPGTIFTPLMTTYLTENTDPNDIEAGFLDKVFIAAKWYPPHGTTNSTHGVLDINKVDKTLSRMEKIGMGLAIHGEMSPHPEIDIFDSEKIFIERKLIPLIKRYPDLKISLEHITTKEACDFIKDNSKNIVGTVTPHHLLFDRNALLVGGLHPVFYNMPILKSREHMLAIQKAVIEDDESLILGTDSAPHLTENKYKDCGCAGTFSAPVALPAYYKFFVDNNITHKFQKFASDNFCKFHGIQVPEKTVEITDEEWIVPAKYHGVEPLFFGQKLNYNVKLLS